MRKIIKKLKALDLEWISNLFLLTILLVLPLGVILTLLEERIFKIPHNYMDGIFLSNIIISIIGILIGEKLAKDNYGKKYEEKIDYLENGIPTKEECELYKDDLKKIVQKYNGEEAFIRQIEFVVKKRAEAILNNLNIRRFDK